MSVSTEYRLIDTSKFEPMLSQSGEVLRRYGQVNARFEAAVDALLANWQGDGADAFRADSEIMRRNMEGMGETLATLCATLGDIHDLLREVDARLGQANQGAA